MRGMLLALLLAGCGAHASTGPAWPKLHEVETDGGEALAPRASNQVAAAVEEDDDDAKPAADEAKPAAAATDTPEVAPAQTSPGAAPQEEPIMGEDITIEIDE